MGRIKGGAEKGGTKREKEGRGGRLGLQLKFLVTPLVQVPSSVDGSRRVILQGGQATLCASSDSFSVRRGPFSQNRPTCIGTDDKQRQTDHIATVITDVTFLP